MKKITLIFMLGIATSALAQQQTKTYQLADAPRYNEETGYGYDLTTTPEEGSTAPFFFSVNVPDGNYKVTVRLGSKKRAGNTTVRAESRRMFINNLSTKKKEFVECSFLVNKRNTRINATEEVRIKAREKGKLNWDDKLTLEFNGTAPACESITIEPADSSVITVFLCGNSTVVDQDNEPWASWGQMIPAFFDKNVCIANYAESGESANTFIAAGRLKKALSQMKAGDYIFMEFGHNDQKQKGPGKGAYYSFMTSLKTFIDEARLRGAHPVLVTPTQRRSFDENGRIRDTHEDYPEAMRWLAAKENVPLIDLNEMIMYVMRICQKTFAHTINIEVALNESKSWVLADPAQLAEVFLSFMDNASDAMTQMKVQRGEKELGGILSVSIEKITGDKVACDTLIRFRQALNEPAYWVVIISDTGVGISPEDQPRIFDPFFTTKNNPENKGLGLTHALTTINSLGGCVDVNSKPGRGTIFKVYLPETDNAASKSNDATADSSLDADEKRIPHGEGLILLVDEDNLMRKVTRKLLEKIGYAVIDTDNGYSALNLYAENMENVVCAILDVSVSQMTNYDIYMSLKGMNPEVDVIVFPDSDQDESSKKLRGEGFGNFIRKPYSLEMLAKMLQRLIAARHSAD